MGREDFILDLNRAAGLVAPPDVRADRVLDSKAISRAIYRGALWLTPKILESYRSEDFSDIRPDTQNALAEAVDAFREIAREVPSDQSASEAQFREGLNRLTSLMAVTRGIVLDDWAPSVDELVDQAEGWSREQGWIVQRVSKRISEGLLDKYDVPQLHIAIEDAHLLFNPAGRFFPGTRGMAEFSRLPTFVTVMIPRIAAGWSVHLESDRGDMERLPWNRDSFLRAADWLRRRP